MGTFRLAILGGSSASDETALAIRNAVSLAVSAVGEQWAICDAGKANLIMMWIDSEKDEQQFALLQQKIPQDRLITLSSHDLSASLWHLALNKIGQPINMLSLTNLLSRVQARFEQIEANSYPVFFDPSEYLCGFIESAVADGVARICKFAGCPDLYLLPKENSFYISGYIQQLLPMALAKQTELQVQHVSEQQILETVSYVKFTSRLSSYLSLDEDNFFQDIQVKKYKRYAINELVWFSVLIASQGRLLPNRSLTTPVLLNQLPEYLRLEYYSKELKPLADCMVANALSISEVAKKTERSLYETIGFYNACSALNLIKEGEEAQQVIEKNLQSRRDLEALFNPIGKALKGRVKIVIAGSVGSGKTTAICTLSDFSPISTETRPSDNVTRKKATTTVAMDYGEMRLHKDLKIFLYGTPGQKRFDFMGQMLCDSAWGMLLLIDNSDPEPFAELDYYLNLYKAFLPKLRVAIGITHMDSTPSPSIGQYQCYLQERGVKYQVMAVDARSSTSLVGLMGGMLSAQQDQLAMTA
ncbi:hypothetical protein JCM14076_08070 [Methylosoma difficile]